MTDLIVIGIVVLIIGIAIVYIVKEKKKGVTCIGCPDAPNCPHRKGGCLGCNNQSHSDTNGEGK